MSWPDIEASMHAHRCRCPLRPDMTGGELVELGGGCRMPSYSCPALDKYRRTTLKRERSSAKPDPTPDPEPQGWSPWDSQSRRG